MSFVESFSKYILGAFNIIFFILSTVLLGFGIWIKVDKSNIHKVLEMVKFNGEIHNSSTGGASMINILAISMMVMGAIIMVTSFCGCCGAFKENKILLYTYLFILSIIVILEISLIIVISVKRNKIRHDIGKEFTRILKKYYNGLLSTDSTLFTKTFGALMIKLKCCGISGRDDFNSFSSWKSNIDNKVIENPVPCCKFKPDFVFNVSKPDFSTIKNALEDKECIWDKNSKSQITNGCAETIWNLIVSKMKILIGIFVAIVIFEIACIIFACCVIHKSYENLK